MKDNRFYTCAYCFKEFEPKRRRIQKFCSNTCRSKAFHARKQKNNSQDKLFEIPSGIQPTTNNDKITLAGIGNATAGTLLAEGLKNILTKEDNKPATKGDFKKLIEIMRYRYLPIKNLPQNRIGQKPYYDVLENNVIYLSNADNTYH